MGRINEIERGDGESSPAWGKLVPLKVGDSDFQVPENICLLQCFQYLKLYAISMGGFCWNAECRTCEVVIQTGSGEGQRVLSCQTMVVPGMTILSMTEKLRFCLKDLIPTP